MPNFEQGNDKKDRELAPEGTHMAYLYQIIDYGTQPSKGQFGDKRICEFSFELVDELRDFGGTMKPMAVHYKVNLPKYLSEKSFLYKLLVELNGGKKLTVEQMKVFNPKEWIGKACSVMVVHSEDGKWANVKSVASLPSKIKMETEQFNPSKTFDLDYFSKDEFDALQEWQQKKIQASPEYQQLFIDGAVSSLDDTTTETPF